MVSKFVVGSNAFFIESNRIIREVTIVSCRGEFYIVRFAGNAGCGGMRIRSSRLYGSKEEAEQQLPKQYQPLLKQKTGFRSPYDYGL